MRRLALFPLALLIALPVAAEIVNHPTRESQIFQAYLGHAMVAEPGALDRAMQLAGESSFLTLEQAESAGRRGDARALIDLAERAVELDPANLEAHELIARTCFQLVERGLAMGGASLSKGMAHAEEHIRLGGSDADLFELLLQARGWAARVATARGDRAGAALEHAAERRTLETWIERLHQERPRELLLEWARDQGNEELEVERLADQLQRTPEDVTVLQRMGELLHRLGRCEQAIPILEQPSEWEGLDELASLGLNVSLCRCANEVGRGDLARRAATRMLGLDPPNLVATAELATSWWNDGEPQLAAEAWDAVELRLTARPRGPGSSGVSTRRTSYLEARARWELAHDLHAAARAHASVALELLPSSGPGGAAQRASLEELVVGILLDAGRVAEASAFARAALAEEPGSAVAILGLADAHWAEGSGAAARALLAEHEAGDGAGDPEFLLRLARWRLARGLLTEAASAAHAALAVLRAAETNAEPVPIPVLITVAETLLDCAQPAESEILLREALLLGGGDADLRHLLADALQEQGRGDEAVILLDEVTGTTPDVYTLERRARWEISHQFADAGLALARTALARAEAVFPGQPLMRARFLGLLGEALTAARLDEEALGPLREALSCQPRPDRRIAIALARALDRRGRALEGVAVLDPLLEQRPDDAGLALERGRLLLKGGRTNEGVTAIEMRVQRALASPGLHRQAALLLDEAGSTLAARAVIDAATWRYPEDLLGWLVSGSLHERHGELDEARANFTRAIEVDPSSAAAWNALGYMLADHGVDLQLAQSALERANRLAPDEAAYLDSLGWACFRLGQNDRASALLELATCRERDPVLLMHLGTIREAQGRMAEALVLYREALHFGLREDVERVEQRIVELAAKDWR